METETEIDTETDTDMQPQVYTTDELVQMNKQIKQMEERIEQLTNMMSAMNSITYNDTNMNTNKNMNTNMNTNTIQNTDVIQHTATPMISPLVSPRALDILDILDTIPQIVGSPVRPNNDIPIIKPIPRLNIASITQNMMQE